MFAVYVMNVMFLLRMYENIAAALSRVGPSGEWWLLCVFGSNKSVFGAFPEGSVEQAEQKPNSDSCH